MISPRNSVDPSISNSVIILPLPYLELIERLIDEKQNHAFVFELFRAFDSFMLHLLMSSDINEICVTNTKQRDFV